MEPNPSPFTDGCVLAWPPSGRPTPSTPRRALWDRSKFDEDDDGKISFEEFIEYMAMDNTIAPARAGAGSPPPPRNQKVDNGRKQLR